MGRTDLLCALFYFGSIMFWVIYLEKGMNRIFYFLSIGAFLLSLLSKEMAVTLPVMLIAVFLFFRVGSLKKRILSAVKEASPFIIVTIAYLIVRIFSWTSQQKNIAGYINYSGLHIIGNYVKWAFGLIYPFDLYKARSLFENNLPVFMVISALVLVFLLMLGGYLVWPSRKRLFKEKSFWLGVAWFAITLLPIMGGNAHRWYLYIPSVSLSFLAVAALRTFHDKAKIVFAVLFAGFLICSSVELYRQSLIWARQSDITENFLDQVEKQGIEKMDALYFANVPFGYKSSFLFTFQSLEPAIFLRYGKMPKIHILSYVNLTDNLHITTVNKPDKILFNMVPDEYGYFIFPPLRRKFPTSGTVLQIWGYPVRLTDLTSSQTVSGYEIAIHKGAGAPLYYYDGRDIIKATQSVF